MLTQQAAQKQAANRSKQRQLALQSTPTSAWMASGSTPQQMQQPVPSWVGAAAATSQTKASTAAAATPAAFSPATPAQQAAPAPAAAAADNSSAGCGSGIDTMAAFEHFWASLAEQTAVSSLVPARRVAYQSLEADRRKAAVSNKARKFVDRGWVLAVP